MDFHTICALGKCRDEYLIPNKIQPLENYVEGDENNQHRPCANETPNNNSKKIKLKSL